MLIDIVLRTAHLGKDFNGPINLLCMFQDYFKVLGPPFGSFVALSLKKIGLVTKILSFSFFLPFVIFFFKRDTASNPKHRWNLGNIKRGPFFSSHLETPPEGVWFF